jgi:hypothetical protein
MQRGAAGGPIERRRVRLERDRRPADGWTTARAGTTHAVASYAVNEQGVEQARRLIDARQYVLDSDWGEVQPRAADENAFSAP